MNCREHQAKGQACVKNVGVDPGSGMVMGAGTGLVFDPIVGPAGLMLCGLIGLPVGAAPAHSTSDQ
jgi:hypothetical protein